MCYPLLIQNDGKDGLGSAHVKNEFPRQEFVYGLADSCQMKKQALLPFPLRPR